MSEQTIEYRGHVKQGTVAVSCPPGVSTRAYGVAAAMLNHPIPYKRAHLERAREVLHGASMYAGPGTADRAYFEQLMDDIKRLLRTGRFV